MQKVIRKKGESFENLMRRFNRKVIQSGNAKLYKQKQRFEKPLSKKEQREVAIRKQARKERKEKQILLRGY